MASCHHLIQYLDEILKPELFSDYCPNGLQVSGKDNVRHIVSGVSACQALLDAAVDEQADLVLVHHGFFWKGENPCVVGIKQKRLSTLLQHHMNLVAYHLPLDAHPFYGNNVQLAERLNIKVDAQFPSPNGMPLGNIGHLEPPMSGEQLANHIEATLNRTPLHISGNSSAIRSIAWCTGAAQDYIEQAVQMNVDAFLTGEVSERTTHIARENGIHFYAAGHHATERYGVAALGEHLAEKFDVTHRFINIENPV